MLPTTKTKPKINLWEHVIFLYGAPKIGKSTLASEIGGAMFLNTSGGLDSLEVFQLPIPDWESFLVAGGELLEGKHDFKVIVIDTIDRLHKLCTNFIIKQQKVVHPQDLAYGKGYDMIKDEFIRPLTKLALSQYGLILISHVKDIEIQTRTSKITRATPTLQNYAWEMIDGLTGIILYFSSERREDGEKRIIRAYPSENWIAGDRTKRLVRAGDIIIQDDNQNWKRIEQAFEGG